MIHDKVIEQFDSKIVALSYKYDTQSRFLLELLNIDKQLYRLTYDFNIYDWQKIQSDEFLENKDSIEGVNTLDRDIRKKQYLLSRVEKYLEWKRNNK